MASEFSHQQLADTLRVLSMDAVQKANSGHPGAPMGMADMATVLWNHFLVHNPGNPQWPNRDRFILSNGHASILLYCLLHLSGYTVSIEDLKNFRQLNSKTPGHPEFGCTPGVETTTGPLGQGFANAVGMALAEKVLGAQFNKPDLSIIDHYTYVFVGDGCLMEGISHEVASFAGVQGLGKLIVFYDDNGISIDGDVNNWFKDNTPARFRAYNWQVIEAVDGHDAALIQEAVEHSKANRSQPTLICCKTVIGKGSPNKAGRAVAHGAPLGEDEVALVRKALHWQQAPFEVDDALYQSWDAREAGLKAEAKWLSRWEAYQRQYPEDSKELQRRWKQELPADFISQSNAHIKRCQEQLLSEPSRKSSLNCLNQYAPLLPELIGGSADLTESNLTFWEGCQPISRSDASGNYIYYGVREFGMMAIGNGISLYGGFIHFGATFLIFMEYARNAVRMAALMQRQSLFVFTHDSIGLGEDGPTHQAVEQLASLRMTPGLRVWRPCDSVESAVAWQQALLNKTPSALVFSRQSLPCQQRDSEQLASIARGGYIVKDCDTDPELIVIATGSEVSLAVQASLQLQERQVASRVVSMPCCEVFEQQDEAYKERVLPAAVKARVAIEAGHPDCWYKYVGNSGRILGLNRYGASAPGAHLMEYFGFTLDNVVKEALLCLDEHCCRPGGAT